jgi:uncharacterized membrane protein YgcG
MEHLEVAIQNYTFWRKAYYDSLREYEEAIKPYNDLPQEDYQKKLREPDIQALEQKCSKLSESRNFAHVIVTLHTTPENKDEVKLKCAR